jgi:hypothetical protein
MVTRTRLELRYTYIASFPFTSPPVRHRVPSHFNWTLNSRQHITSCTYHLPTFLRVNVCPPLETDDDCIVMVVEERVDNLCSRPSVQEHLEKLRVPTLNAKSRAF